MLASPWRAASARADPTTASGTGGGAGPNAEPCSGPRSHLANSQGSGRAMLIADTSITATRQSVGATEGADILLPRVNCRHNGWEPSLGGSFLLAWLLPSAFRRRPPVPSQAVYRTVVRPSVRSASPISVQHSGPFDPTTPRDHSSLRGCVRWTAAVGALVVVAVEFERRTRAKRPSPAEPSRVWMEALGPTADSRTSSPVLSTPRL